MTRSSSASSSELLSSLSDALSAAPRLIGCVLGRRQGPKVRSGIIVETEAYLADDPASHAFKGRTKRNGSMFGPAGTAYVYVMHRCHCVNVVTGNMGRGEAVLIRAIEPLEGLDLMADARAKASVGLRRPRGHSLTDGPGKLCQALDITLVDDGAALISRNSHNLGNGLYLVDRNFEPDVGVSTRVGISRGQDAAYRFFLENNRWVSR